MKRRIAIVLALITILYGIRNTSTKRIAEKDKNIIININLHNDLELVWSI